MDLNFDTSLIVNYKNPSQKIRIMSEHWVGNYCFCPNCGNTISAFQANNPVADFYCHDCKEQYELKSKGNKIGNIISDGAYNTMIARLNSSTNPNFFFLNYNQGYQVKNFLIIPKYFFTPDIIEKRKPLSKNARRAGWVGCNILLRLIPDSGKVFYIKDEKIFSRKTVVDNFQKTSFLKNQKQELKGWLLDIMLCIDTLKKKEFSLDELYLFTKRLALKYPKNKHIRDKIRQQLQMLRDKGYLEFMGNGKYKLS